MSIDMHCHLDLYPRPDLVAEESKRRGTYILSVTTTLKHGMVLLYWLKKVNESELLLGYILKSRIKDRMS
ncbi:TatD-related deoxyribonuclease [Escherichia coli]|uniref:TatD-related deoxyribonuclease n=1 Tax=Escherichia coli TaxID=562 RepID=A0A484YC53_ECOLX|nr:TatD-related deoxyribonuclease [Escherichia coli]